MVSESYFITSFTKTLLWISKKSSFLSKTIFLTKLPAFLPQAFFYQKSYLRTQTRDFVKIQNSDFSSKIIFFIQTQKNRKNRVSSSSITSFQSFAFLTTKTNIVFRLCRERHVVKNFFKTGNFIRLVQTCEISLRMFQGI